MTDTGAKYREIPLPSGVYDSRMAALNACLKAISGSTISVEKVAVFEDPPRAILHISSTNSESQKERKSKWLPSFFGTAPKQKPLTTLELNVDKQSRADKSYTLKYEINPA